MGGMEDHPRPETAFSCSVAANCGAAESRPVLPEAREFIRKDAEGDGRDHDQEHEGGCEAETEGEPVEQAHNPGSR
jgi:hypothetical protein